MFRRCAARSALSHSRVVAERCVSSSLLVAPRGAPCAPLNSGRLVSAALMTNSRLYSTTCALRAPKHVAGEQDTDGESLLDFEFDPMASVQHDAAVESAKQNIDTVAQNLAPDHAPPAVMTKIRAYLEQHPVDRLIVATHVQITHVQNPESGAEDKANLSPCTLEEALEQAQLRKLNLVQMGARGETAFCRLRDERPWVAKLVADDMKEVEAMLAAQGESGYHDDSQGGGHHPTKTRPLVDHQFRDVVDAHFVGWKSKKICHDLKKRHPVKLTIREFQGVESAVFKMREMCTAMQKYAEEEHIYHYFTSIVANDRELSVTFSPASANKSGTVSHTVKHPGEKEWAHTLKRMSDACQKAGRSGTYVKSASLKPRNVGATMYRVDKYGRRID